MTSSLPPPRPPDTLTAPLILIADDQADIVEALRLLLKSEGYRTTTAHVPEGVLALLEKEQADAALIDLNYTRDTTSGREGLDLLSRIRALDPTLPVIVMTAWGSVDKAVEAMRRGARDFIEKVASTSGTSGKPYLIRFNDGREIRSREYLLAELQKLEP